MNLFGKLSARVGALGAAIALVAGAILASTSAATAADKPALPDGWVMYAADCNDYEGQLYSIDVATGVATAIGEGNTGVPCPYQGHYDPKTGNTYLPGAINGGIEYYTATVNVETGVITKLPGATDTVDGALTGDADGNMYFITPTGGGTGVDVTKVDPITGDPIPGSVVSITFAANYNHYAFAYNPTDGKFYTLDWDNNEFLTIDPTAATVTRTGVFIDTTKTIDGTPNPYSLAIDSNGIAWVQDDRYQDPGLSLAAVDLATGETWRMFDLAVNETLYPNNDFYVFSMWLMPAESSDTDSDSESETESGTDEEAALPETGSEISGLTAIVGFMAIVAGAGAIAARRLTKLS